MIDQDRNEAEARQEFLNSGTSFFKYNGGRNTPNILLQLSERVERLEHTTKQTAEAVGKLDASIRDASASSGRLTTVLNRLTLAYLIVTGLGVVVAAIALAHQMMRD